MIHQLAAETTTFDEFIAWLPERSEYRYELHDGEIIKMPKPRGKHSDIAGFISAELNFIIRRSAFDGEYDVQMFRDLEKLQSGIFPELELTLSQILML
jgi:Putative restriction endonuclease